MAKNRNDYFEMVKKQAGYCVEASELLEKMLCNFSPKDIPMIRGKMHEIEHRADDLHHEIQTKLSAEFITPIDQEDILRLVQIIDDVTDALDEVVLDFYMYHLEVLPEGADEFAKLVNCCVKAFYNATAELKHFKKPDNLRSLLVEVNTIESEADSAYTESIHTLFLKGTDAKILFCNKEIFEGMEDCCDLCEHAADVIEQIIIKNT